ncbi:hypothetical protein OE749_08670 [Aestuariibacter sp. AA17]|uniref:Ig-like domain-containing protein n=1 Tax=Fluctibacter corallii TaxID=2984329 RepID=A0ABT3A7W0_9ALTE|nr:hypothetical protein [Aestuariibacter sp. AA17]MCV2884768.1 hypothetical protein [Aestuariibacter sp. AA17]
MSQVLTTLILSLCLSFAVAATPAPFINSERTTSTVASLTAEPVIGATSYQWYVNGNSNVHTISTAPSLKLSVPQGALTRVSAKACRGNDCSDLGNEITLLSPAIIPDGVDLTGPSLVKVGEKMCLKFKPSARTSTYFVYHNGNDRVGSCITLTTPGMHFFDVAACGKGCTRSNVHDVLAYVEPKGNTSTLAPSLNAPAYVSPNMSFTVEITARPGASYFELYLNDQLIRSTLEPSYTAAPSGDNIQRFKVRACNQNKDCGPFSEEITVVLDRRKAIQTPYFEGLANSVEANTRFCASDISEPNATHYFLSKNGVSRHTTDFPKCMQEEPGVYAYSVKACKHECSYSSATKYVSVLPGIPSRPRFFSNTGLQQNVDAELSLPFPPVAESSGNTNYELWVDGQHHTTQKSSPFRYSSSTPGRFEMAIRACNEAGCSEMSETVTAYVLPPQLDISTEHPHINTLMEQSFTVNGYTNSYKFDVYVKERNSNYRVAMRDISTPNFQMPFPTPGYYCTFIRWTFEGWAIKQSRETCFFVHEPFNLVSFNGPKITLSHTSTYTFTPQQFTFHPDNGQVRIHAIDTRGNFTLSENGTRIHPIPNKPGNHEIDIQLADRYGLLSNTLSVPVTVLDGRPTALSGTYTIQYKDTYGMIFPFSSQADPRGLDITSVSILQYSRYGTLEIGSDIRTIQYTSTKHACVNQGDVFEDEFTYVITNSEGLQSLPGVAKIKISCPYSAIPIATDDAFYYKKNHPVTFNVMSRECDAPHPSSGEPNGACTGRDYDNYQSAITLNAISQPPKHGELYVVGDAGSIVYSPQSDSCQLDWFFYTIKNQNGLISEPALVRLECDNAPKAVDDHFVIPYTAPYNLDVLANDTLPSAAQDDALPSTASMLKVHQITSQAKSGATRISMDKQFIVYTPDASVCIDKTTFEDNFAYQIMSHEGEISNSAEVSLIVHCQTLQLEKSEFSVGENNQLMWRLNNGVHCRWQESPIKQLEEITQSGSLPFTFYSLSNSPMEFSCSKGEVSPAFTLKIDYTLKKLATPTLHQRR